MLLHDVTMTSYCCQRYAECLVMTVFPAGQCTDTPRSENVWSPNFLTPNLWPANSPDLKRPVDYEIWAVMQHRFYHRQIHSVDKLKRRLIDVWCGLEQSIFDETIESSFSTDIRSMSSLPLVSTIDQWRGRH